MIPRAEITMIIMQKGLARGIIDESVYSGMVLVSAVTCILGPILLRWMLQNHKEGVAP
jgi:Kef-type K+ transport system membrane component KefB